MAEGDEPNSLEYTPTWTVALVCIFFIAISIALERGIHSLGRVLLRKGQIPLFEALQKLKEELMLLGFISLFLTVFQRPINRICISEHLMHDMLPCKWPGKKNDPLQESSEDLHHRRLLAVGKGHGCKEGKKPFVSLEGMHQLHTFIFVLAVVHAASCVLTMLLATAQSRAWRSWEKEIHARMSREEVPQQKLTHVAQDAFVSKRAKWIALSWVHSFIKQFYSSITKADYSSLRLGFIETHCKTRPNFDFHKYMMKSLEIDFKKVVGISAYLWAFVVIFLLLNLRGWNTYFWISFIPLILLLIIGTKLEHVIVRLAHEVLEKHTMVIGDIVVRPSDEHFWFKRPKLVLHLIHFILFQNAFELAYFFWILTTFGMYSCIMGRFWLTIGRLIIWGIVQFLCGYSTLPLYALVTQMGSSFRSAIFQEHIHRGIANWRERAKMNAKKPVVQSPNNGNDEIIEMQTVGHITKTT